MIQSLLKVAVFGALIQFLRPRFRGLLAVAVGIAVTFLVHSEYLSYVDLTGDTAYLLKSYWLKWTLITLIIFLYTVTVEVCYRKPRVNSDNKMVSAPKELTGSNVNDGFDFIRRKKRLTTHAEGVLNRPGKTNE